MPKKKTTKKKTAKKTTRKKSPTKPEPIEVPQGILDRMLDLVVMEGKSFEDAERELMISKDPKIVAAARVEIASKISNVASFDRVEEIGAGIMRLKSIFAAAKLAGELTAAISAQTQIGKLLALYPKAGDTPTGGGDASGESSKELELVEQHLRPLGIAPDDYPISGLARIAADRIRQLESKA